MLQKTYEMLQKTYEMLRKTYEMLRKTYLLQTDIVFEGSVCFRFIITLAKGVFDLQFDKWKNTYVFKMIKIKNKCKKQQQ